MIIDEYDEQYRILSEKKMYTAEVMKEIRNTTNRCLVKRDFSELTSSLSLCENEMFSMNTEMSRLMTVLQIYINERDYRDEELFISNISDMDKLLEKYVVMTLYLRRFEFNYDSDFISEAADYLKEERVSPEAVLEIVNKELFEKREKVVQSVYFCLKEKLNPSEKAEWLCCMYEKYKTDWILEEMRELDRNE